ncbi:restriction endonuclease [Fibrella sp. WM1]|uniref:nSTAND3 domain-containing NTPase n=1 Tax=Fibrella musci TaxID=3242485 RepID=UPI0035229275
MLNYDFLNLSPLEFESLSRDLLQCQLQIMLESFTSGKDGGIDLRYISDGKSLIVQCKRYNNYSSLYSDLKKEVLKLRKLNPNRYILVTSSGLTPFQKKEILDLFGSFIKIESDILGKDEVNNLLGKYPSIEKKYYKLWLTSINIMDKILNSRVYNGSEFALQEIQNKVKLYIQNEGVNQCIEKINSNRYVIISGLPGVGKTALANYLAVYYLGMDYQEFVYISSNIQDGVMMYKPDVKQVFFFR